MGRRTFTWREQSYRLDSSTWHFWGRGRLIQLPGDGSEFRMAPDDTLFLKFAVKAGFEPGEDSEDADTELATRLMDRLIYWYFVTPF